MYRQQFCTGQQYFHLNMYRPPVGKRTFQAKVTKHFACGYTIETTVDGKPLRGILFPTSSAAKLSAHGWASSQLLLCLYDLLFLQSLLNFSHDVFSGKKALQMQSLKWMKTRVMSLLLNLPILQLLKMQSIQMWASHRRLVAIFITFVPWWKSLCCWNLKEKVLLVWFFVFSFNCICHYLWKLLLCTTCADCSW